MTINSTSYKEFPVKILEDQQKKSVAFIRLISTLMVPLVIVPYGNISIKTEWREYSLKNNNVLNRRLRRLAAELPLQCLAGYSQNLAGYSRIEELKS